MAAASKTIKRIFRGVVVSDKGMKTAVIRVDRIKIHPKYNKRYVISKKYKAHDEKNEYNIGDQVLIQECRPLSKDKSWLVVGRANQSKIAELVVKERLMAVDDDLGGEIMAGMKTKNNKDDNHQAINKTPIDNI